MARHVRYRRPLFRLAAGCSVLFTIVAAILVTGGAISLPLVARADDTSLWHQSLPGRDEVNLLTDPTGVFLQHEGGPPAHAVYERYGNTGQLGPTLSGLPGTYAPSVSDLNGDIFEVLNTDGASTPSSTLEMRAVSGIQWQSPIPSPASGEFRLGLGGNRVYVLDVGTQNPQYVHAFDPADGKLIHTLALPAGFNAQSIHAYNGGVLLTDNTVARSVIYITQDAGSYAQYAPGANSVQLADAAVTSDGRGFVLTRGGADDSTLYVDAFSPTDGLLWSQPLPLGFQSAAQLQYGAFSGGDFIAAQSDGGVIVGENGVVWFEQGGAITTTDGFVKFTPAGVTAWTGKADPSIVNTGSVSPRIEGLHATSTGKFIVAMQGGGVGFNADWTHFDEFDSASGAKIGTVGALNNVDTQHGYTYPAITSPGSLALGAEDVRLYVVVSNYVDVATGVTSVFSFPGNGLGTTYPEDAARATIVVGSSPTPTPSSTSPLPTATATPTPSPTPSMPIPPNVAVWLGDSYSSGEGVPPFMPNSATAQNRCHRSTRSYGERLTGTIGFPKKAVFAACSGAVIDNFYTGQGQYNETQGQLQNLDVRDKLVAFTVGGNDVGFPQWMSLCLGAANCQLNDTFVSSAISDTKARLGPLYATALAQAPRAKIYVLGYPHLFAANVVARCRVEGLQNSEARWINHKVDALNGAIQAEIQATDNVRLHYVDTTDAFAGGEACSASHQFMNEVVALHPEYSFHPTAAGQSMLASTLAHAVRGH